jgi:hypothetical protein
MARYFLRHKIKKNFLFFCFSFALAVGSFCINEEFSPYFIKFKSAPPFTSISHTFSHPFNEDLLKENFFYKEKGSQSFVFFNKDQTAVLKFFRCNRYFIPSFLTPDSLPQFLKDIYEEKRRIKEENWFLLMKSCSLAHERLDKECGLLFVHLHESDNLSSKLMIEDKIKRQFIIDPNTTLFIIQKKATLLYDFLKDCKIKGDLSQAKLGIENLFKLIRCRQEKGIGDRDPALSKNIGFIGVNPIFLDIGQFYLDENLTEEKKIAEIVKMCAKITPWIEQHCPEFLPFFEEALSHL